MHSKRLIVLSFCCALLLVCLAWMTSRGRPTVAAAADHILLVSSTASHQVLIFDAQTGQALGKLTAPPANQPVNPTGLVVGSDGDYYVASSGQHQILRFESTSWAFKDVFVAAGSGGLASPQGLAMDGAGLLYATSATDQILRYDSDGSFKDVFVDGNGPDGGGLKGPRSIAFGPDGHLYALDSAHKNVLRYDGVTGKFLGDFTTGDTLGAAADLIFGPDGHLYVSDPNSLAVYQFNGAGGALLDAFGGSGLSGPHGLGFFNNRLHVANQDNNSVVWYDSEAYDWPVLVNGAGLDQPSWLRFAENRLLPTATPTATGSATGTATVTPTVSPTPQTGTPGASCAAVDPEIGPLVWTVNTTADDLVTSLTLRCALTFARSGDSIRFDPAVFPALAPGVIQLASALPPVTQGALHIDAQGAGVVLDGRGLAPGNPVLALHSDTNRVQGLHLRNGPAVGLHIRGNGNLIGVAPTGRGPIQTAAGIPAAPANLINDNGGAGVLIEGDQNQLFGAYIGVDSSGNQAAANGSHGVWVAQGAGNRIGASDGGNLISGNQGAGIHLSGEATTGNQILGNRIGLSLDGLLALGNQVGVEIRENAQRNVVGSVLSGEANTIAGNRSHGVHILGSETAFNRIVRNFIGTSEDELLYTGGNGGSGVVVEAGAHDNAIGQDSAGYLGNVIVFSQGAGVELNSARKNLVASNRIGQLPSGQSAGNQSHGIHLRGSGDNELFGNWIANNGASGARIEEGSANNAIGRDGFSGGDFNVIVGNSSHGVHISGQGSNGNGVINNRIGTTIHGDDNLGNSLVGIYLQSGPAQSLIWKNRVVNATGGGIVLDDADNHQITGNWIGVVQDLNEALIVLGNRGHGIYLLNGASGNEVSSNRITASTGDGVRVEDQAGGQTIGNRLTANSIYANALAGIGLNGGNRGLSAPRVTDVRRGPANLWTIEGESCPDCRIEFFQDAADEGETFFAFAEANGEGKFTWTLAPPEPGQGYTLTATDPEGNTSAFSEAYTRTFASLVADHVEITQVVQSLDTARFPEVPLVAGKRTFVRFHVHANGEGVAGVTARLSAFRGDERLEPGDVRPVPTTDNLFVRSFPDRANRGHAFIFWVPGDWTRGTVTFRLEINPERAIRELNYNDNMLEKEVEFVEVPAVCLAIVRVRTNPRTASINDPGFWTIVRRAESMYPATHFQVYNTGHTVEEGGFDAYEMPEDRSKVLSSLWTYNLMTDDPDECGGDMYYYGIVHPDHYDGAEVIGSGYRPGDEAWGFMFTDGFHADRPWDGPTGGNTMAHELGHNDNRRHVDCGNPANPDPDYPYHDASGNDCMLGPDDPLAYYGYDAISGAVIHPNDVGDLMSYRGTTWTSDYTYRGILLRRILFARRDAGQARAEAQMQALTDAPELLVVTGLISPTSGAVTLDPIYRVVSGTVNARKVAETARIQASRQATDTVYALRLLNGTGGLIREQTFPLADVSESDGAWLPLHLLAPASPDVAAVVIVAVEAGAERELARRSASANPPLLELLAPKGGESVGQALTIEWSATDADGDPLHFNVQYSPDNGKSWRLLAQNHPTTTLTVDSSQLPGSPGQALVRVTASDGLHTHAATVGAPFTVPFQAPQVFIDAEQATVYGAGAAVQLTGRAVDAEEAQLPGGSFVWQSDRDGSLGVGRQLYTNSLSTGEHRITLTVTDSQGKTGSASLTIAVGMNFLHLPLVGR